MLYEVLYGEKAGGAEWTPKEAPLPDGSVRKYWEVEPSIWRIFKKLSKGGAVPAFAALRPVLESKRAYAREDLEGKTPPNPPFLGDQGHALSESVGNPS